MSDNTGGPSVNLIVSYDYSNSENNNNTYIPLTCSGDSTDFE